VPGKKIQEPLAGAIGVHAPEYAESQFEDSFDDLIAAAESVGGLPERMRNHGATEDHAAVESGECLSGHKGLGEGRGCGFGLTDFTTLRQQSRAILNALEVLGEYVLAADFDGAGAVESDQPFDLLGSQAEELLARLLREQVEALDFRGGEVRIQPLKPPKLLGQFAICFVRTHAAQSGFGQAGRQLGGATLPTGVLHAIAQALDDGVGRTVVLELGFLAGCEIFEDILGQDFAQLHAPLVE